LDLDNNNVKFYKNNTQLYNLSNLLSDEPYTFAVSHYIGSAGVSNFGQDGTFAGAKTAQGNADGNGYGNFYYSPPSGYLALCTQNLATELSPTIDDGSQYFTPLIYTGNSANPASGGQAITGVGFAPDFTWIKNRNDSNGHMLYDTVRGAGADKSLTSNNSAGEPTNGENHFPSFGSDGFTVAHDDSGSTNNNGESYISWNWKASGSTASNTDGTITSTVSANTTSGFSIVTYTGTGSNATVGHGLGKALKFLIVKDRDASEGWIINSQILTGNTNGGLHFNTDAEYTGASTQFQATNPTSTVFSIGTAGNVNNSGDKYVAYCFAPIEGYSKFGSYTGNGSTDGVFVYTGFKPTWFLAKRTDSTSHWTMLDGTRNSFNVAENYLHANESNAENTNNQKVDFLSNGIKLRSVSRHNDSGGTYIYMAFAENPFVDSNGVPVTAR